MKTPRHLPKRRWGIPTLLWILWLAVLALVLSGCATPVGVKPVDTQTAYRIQTESALAAGQPSEPSKRVLRRLGLLDRFDAEPAAVLAELHRGLTPQGDDDRLFALAELSFLHADRTGDRAYFLAAAVYSWALLFPDDDVGTRLLQRLPAVVPPSSISSELPGSKATFWQARKGMAPNRFHVFPASWLSQRPCEAVPA